PLSIGPCWWR
ncbi:prkA AAA domain protein, partial [Vibrio parahaemolyticus V-223/04]